MSNQTFSCHLSMGILAHVDAGKTTLSESILYLTGAIRKMGRVDHKDAFLDLHPVERERGITVFSDQAVFDMGADEDIQVCFTLGRLHDQAVAGLAAEHALLEIDQLQGDLCLWKLAGQLHIALFDILPQHPFELRTGVPGPRRPCDCRGHQCCNCNPCFTHDASLLGVDF